MLIINADDFGLSEGVCRGVVRAMRAGVVSSTTAMVCVEDAPAVIRRHALDPDSDAAGRVGLHLQLTSGAPVLPAAEVPTLVDVTGRFPKRRKAIESLNTDEVLREWRAQAARLQALGVTISHLDAHHHIHRREDAFPAFLTLARELGLPARAKDDSMRDALRAHGVATPDLFIGSWYDGELTPQTLADAVAEAVAAHGAPLGAESLVAELMCHPGEVDEALATRTGYVAQRQAELEALLHPETRRLLTAMGVAIAPGFVV